MSSEWKNYDLKQAYGELSKLAAEHKSDVVIGMGGDKLFVYYQKRRTPLGWVPEKVGVFDVVTAYTGRIRAAARKPASV